MSEPTPNVAPPSKRLGRLAMVRSSNVDKVTSEGEEVVSLCNYVDVYYHDRITGTSLSGLNM